MPALFSLQLVRSPTFGEVQEQLLFQLLAIAIVGGFPFMQVIRRYGAQRTLRVMTISLVVVAWLSSTVQFMIYWRWHPDLDWIEIIEFLKWQAVDWAVFWKCFIAFAVGALCLRYWPSNNV